MDPEAISALIIRGAEQYCRYLGTKKERKDRGEEVHDVWQLDRYPDGTVMLRLRYGLTDLSLTALEIKGKRIDREHYTYKSYDDFSKTLEMKVDDTIFDEFSQENKNHIKIIFDFKFLIDRIINYLKQYGSYLEFPTKGAHLSPSFTIPAGLTPSDDQKNAIATCLTEPVSYVWGAPGTGKTQFVLANSILADIKAGMKVAVFAPTNNSVEQVLRGLIKEISENPELKQHIDLNKDVLRVGYASVAFQSTFPKMCEHKRVNKNGKVLKHTLRALWDTRNEMVIDAQTPEMAKIIRRAEEYDKLSPSEKDDLEDRFYKLIESLKNIHILSQALQESSVLDIKRSMEVLKEAATNRPRPRRYMPEYASFSLDMMDELIHNVEQEYKALTGKSPYKTVDVKLDPGFKSAYGTNEISEKSSTLRKTRRDSDEDRAKRKGKLEKSQMDSEETSAALDSAKIIVCTPHQFFKRMIPACVPPEGNKHVLDVGHIYVDEAGYANLMHILPLLTIHVPITLLGDHMQLETAFTMGHDEAVKYIRDGTYPLAFLWGLPAIHLESMFAANNVKDVQKIFIENLDPAFKDVKLSILKKSYRFGDNLAKILDQYIYGNIGLEGASEDGNLTIECIPVKSDCAYENRNEADAISTFLKEADVPESTVVLTPYRKQVKLIRDSLPDNARCEVMTIHASQGREWDAVIVSVVDSKPFERSFMNSRDFKHKKVVNTAVSRAKHKLVVVCDYDSWNGKEGQLVSALIKYANDHGDVYTSLYDAIDDLSRYDDDDDY